MCSDSCLEMFWELHHLRPLQDFHHYFQGPSSSQDTLFWSVAGLSDLSWFPQSINSTSTAEQHQLLKEHIWSHVCGSGVCFQRSCFHHFKVFHPCIIIDMSPLQGRCFSHSVLQSSLTRQQTCWGTARVFPFSDTWVPF